MKAKRLVLFVIPIFPSISYLYFSNFDKKLYVATFFYFLALFISQKYFEKNSLNYLSDIYINQKIFYPILLIFLIITQNRYLNIETITWDVSSYLVASNEIKYGFLPLETQWESKGPLTIYVYYFLSFISGNNYVLFKLLNDLILFFTILIFISITKMYDSKQSKKYFSAILLTSIFSIQWFVSEYTEFFCLPLIGIANYLHLKNKEKNKKYIGFIFGISFLINQGSVLFFLPIVIDYFLDNLTNKKIVATSVIKYSFWFSLPSLFFIFIYWRNDLLEVLVANYFDIPLGYVGENASSFYELRVFLREISVLNYFTYFSIITIFFFYVTNVANRKNFKLNNLFDLINLNIIFSLLYYFIAGHNFYHHLIYFLYFSIFLIIKINRYFQTAILSTMIILSSIVSFYVTFPSSINNLSNLNATYDNYPMKNLAELIDSNFNDDNYSVFALDFVIVLNYLEKTNFSYIVHPTNHYQKYITDVLIDLNMIKKDNIIQLVSENPDVIICNTKSIDNGGRVMSTDPRTYGNNIEEGTKHFCDFENLKNEYFQLKTEEFRLDPNLNYYFDPYKEMNVFVKKNY